MNFFDRIHTLVTVPSATLQSGPGNRSPVPSPEAASLASIAALWNIRLASERMIQTPRLILASASPRRIELLSRTGLEFAVIESGIAEIRRDNESACAYATRMASEKACAVSRRSADALVLAADTIVECGGQILEKPKSEEDARRMLNTLSDRAHTVVTAFALARNGALLESTPVLSRVTFRRLGSDEIEAYIASGEPFDKAGAYGIQGAGGDFIARVEGSRDNVMGLPLSEVRAALERHGFRRRSASR